MYIDIDIDIDIDRHHRACPTPSLGPSRQIYCPLDLRLTEIQVRDATTRRVVLGSWVSVEMEISYVTGNIGKDFWGYIVIGSLVNSGNGQYLII